IDATIVALGVVARIPAVQRQQPALLRTPDDAMAGDLGDEFGEQADDVDAHGAGIGDWGLGIADWGCGNADSAFAGRLQTRSLAKICEQPAAEETGVEPALANHESRITNHPSPATNPDPSELGVPVDGDHAIVEIDGDDVIRLQEGNHPL